MLSSFNYLHRTGRQSSLNISRWLVEAIWPPQCARCRTKTDRPGNLCGDCWSRLSLIDKPLCNTMGSPMPFDAGGDIVSTDALNNPPPWDRLRAPVQFNEHSRPLVHALKYRDRHDVAGMMARMMVHAGREIFSDAALIVPVPLHWRRLWQRRFNQSALLGRAIADLTGISFSNDVIKRARATKSQVGLKSADRRRNVKGAFIVPEQAHIHIAGRHIVLVDDVKTTGATLSACAKALKSADAAAVDVVVFALVTGDD